MNIYHRDGRLIRTTSLATLRGADLTGADLKGTYLKGADLGGAFLQGVDLRGAGLTEADLRNADLRGADLTEADLRNADLGGAFLQGVDLTRAVLRNADLTRANIRNADLTGADLKGAVLRWADLTGAYLLGATMPDGRKWEMYVLDPLAGICDDPEARKRAVAAWGNHTWQDCPLHAGNGWNDTTDAPEAKRISAYAFVAVFDAGLLGLLPVPS